MMSIMCFSLRHIKYILDFFPLLTWLKMVIQLISMIWLCTIYSCHSWFMQSFPNGQFFNWWFDVLKKMKVQVFDDCFQLLFWKFQVGHLEEQYQEWVHQPIVSKEGPRFFENDVLEVNILFSVMYSIQNP